MTNHVPDNTSKSNSARRDRVVSASTKAMSAAGVIAAMAMMILANLLSARHYARWDCTTAKLYTLSTATEKTVQGLEQTVEIEVLLPPSDPLHRSIRNLLNVYRSKTERINVRYVDPDRHPAEFVAVQQKYDIVAGRTEDGRVVTDAAIVVSSRERHWFILAEDLVDFSDLDEGLSKSKIEQSLTAGIRAVLGGQRRRLCFTSGHGEYSVDDMSGQGLGELRDRLVKNNYDVDQVNSSQGEPSKAFADCHATVVVGPSVPFSRPEADAMVERMRAGMGGFFLLSPMLDTDTRSQLATGLESVTRIFGVGIASDYVFELDDDARVPRGSGEVFFANTEAHAVTDGLLGLSMAMTGMRIITVRSRSFDVVDGEVHPAAILKTSKEAFGMTDFHSWALRGGDPIKGASDRNGPLAIGLAAELPKSELSENDHGARLVVLGSANYVLGQNWRDMALRGNAVLAGNIISWVAAHQPIVDVPAKITPAATLRLSESSLSEIVRYVLLYMPGAALLLSIAMYMRRRSGQARPTRADKSKQTDSCEPNPDAENRGGA